MALYPPIVASSMPAFNVDPESQKQVKIYFYLPVYNTFQYDEIQQIQYTVRRQTSNVNVLDSKSEIKSVPIGVIEENRTDEDKALNRYFIIITNDDIKDGFIADVLYKVQLRFSSILSENNTPTVDIFYHNINLYSEWSTVCIIKPIIAPKFYIQDFQIDGANKKNNKGFKFYYSLADFVGVYKTELSNGKYSSQVLKQWRLRLLKGSYDSKEQNINMDNYLLSDSGWVASSANNYTIDNKSLVLSCSLPYEFSTTDPNNDNTKTYKLLFNIRTKNDYEDSVLYEFDYQQQNLNPISGDFYTYTNQEEGYIKVTFSNGENWFGNLVLRRSSSKDNFLKWEDLKFFVNLDDDEEKKGINFTYYDFTAQSGVLYRYLIQKIDTRGRRGTPAYDQVGEDNKGTMVEYEHAFLLESAYNESLSDVKQLKLKFDFEISSYKTNISENLTNTIGSKYPFIRRNGNMYYRSFPCSGTITGFMDEASLFTTREEVLDGYSALFKEFNGQVNNNLDQKYDFTYERRFREKVQEFLYNTKPKLYKSMQEGNIFIKLMDVSLTPKNELGRLVYSFSATAYEIDQFSIQSLSNYGILNIGLYNPNVKKTISTIGQITSYSAYNQNPPILFKANQDIMGAGSSPAANSIANFIKYNQTFNRQKVTSFYIDWLRITIDSQPYLIREIGGKYEILDDINNGDEVNVDPTYYSQNMGDIQYPLYQIESTYSNIGNIYLGHLFEINGKPIIVSYPNNIYEIKESIFRFNQNVTIIPKKDTLMTVDFNVNYTVQVDFSTEPKKIEIGNTNGQLIGTFSEDINLIHQIRIKHTYNDDKEKIKRILNSVKSILIDTQPNTIIKMKLKNQISDAQLSKFVVNDTGVLNFDSGEYSDQNQILEMRIAGINISIENINDRGLINDFSTLRNVQQGDFCTKDGFNYSYYNGKWYKANAVKNDKNIIVSYDIQCPVDALVFYYAAIERDYY